MASEIVRRAIVGAVYRRTGSIQKALNAALDMGMNKSGTYGWFNCVWERVLLDTDYFTNILTKKGGYFVEKKGQ